MILVLSLEDVSIYHVVVLVNFKVLNQVDLNGFEDALKNFYEPVNLLFSCHSLPYSTMYVHTCTSAGCHTTGIT